MLLFIALPIVSVAVQSLHIEHEAVMIEVENCGPFGCKQELQVDVEKTAKLKKDRPLGQFNGLGTYTNRNHLAFTEIGLAWQSSTGVVDFFFQGAEPAVLSRPFIHADLHFRGDTFGHHLWLHDRAWRQHIAKEDQRANDFYLPITDDSDTPDWIVDLVLDD